MMLNANGKLNSGKPYKRSVLRTVRRALPLTCERVSAGYIITLKRTAA